MKTYKKSIFIFVLVVALVLCLVTGAAFAYYKFVWQGGKHTISSFAVTFTFNGKSFIDILDGHISSDSLDMSLGQERDLGLNVSLISGTDSTVGYNIRFEFGTKTVDGVEVVDDGLARAIEVYLYTDGEYEFLCNLDKIENQLLSGGLVAGQSFSYDMRLIYSQAAGLAYEGKTFTLIAMAETVESAEVGSAVYVRTENGLISVLSDEKYDNKQIVLQGDIRLSQDIVTTNRVGINLNGFKLLKADTAQPTPTLTFAHTRAYDASLAAGIMDDRAVSASSNTTSPKIEVNVVFNTPNDFCVVGASLLDSYANISCRAFSLDAARQIAQARLDEVSSKMFVDGKDLKVFDGFDWYIKRNIIQIETLDSVFNAADLNGSTLVGGVLRVLTQKEYTANNEIEFSLVDLVGTQTTQRVGGVVCVRGNSPEAIAESLLDTVPSKITGNLYFPVKDVATNSAITWIISDGDADYLDSAGTFVPSGFDSLTDWNTKTVTVGVKVSSGTIQYTVYKSVEVEVFGAEQRTEKLYKYEQIILQPEQTISLLEYVNADLMTRTGLQRISITLNAEDNAYADTLNYLGVSELSADSNGIQYQSLSVLNSPTDGVAAVRAQIAFEYADVGNYVLNDVEIIVLSRTTAYEINDGANTLQKQYETNPYTLGEGYEFFVTANLTDGVLVEYTVPSGFRNYVMVRNGLYEPATAADLSSDYSLLGFYALIDGQYVYFESATRYDSAGTIASHGGYVKVVLPDGTEVLKNLSSMIADGEIFRRVAKITINAQNLSTQTITATIYANLYTIENGEKVYKTETKIEDGVSVTTRIAYNFSLVLKGIYHNNAQEIADFNLYSALVTYFDANNDGFIGVDEASAWSSVSFETVEYYKTSYNYLDFSNLGITTLKGLEYFSGIRGIDLSGNAIIDISELAQLRYLTYLDLSNNMVTSLASLEYSDNLRALILSGNNITSIEPLRYLPDLAAIDLNENNIGDFDPIGSHSNFIYLDLRYSGRTTTSADVRYYFALIYVNNINNVVGGTAFSMKTEITGTGIFVATGIEMAAATAMSQVMEIHEVYNSLYTPAYINYNGEEFYLKWDSPTNDRIVFSSSQNGFYTTGCTIMSGIVEEKITLTLVVTDVSNTASSILLQRTFDIVLLPAQDGDSTPFVQLPIAVATAAGLTANYSDGTYAYVRANLAIPDMALRNKLFNFFNTTQDEDDENPVVIFSDGGVLLREKYVLTYEEMTNPVVVLSSYSFANSGIADLTGLSLFSTVFVGTVNLRPSIDLRNNDFDDLTELSKMNGLTTLYLGGAEYDFTQMLGTAVENSDGQIVDWTGGLTSLTALYVYQCYNLSSDANLRALYMTYIENPSASIFIVNDQTEWNPYEQLRKYSQEWTQLYYVYDLGIVNYFDGDSVSVRFYDYRDVNFYVTAATFDFIRWNANQEGANDYFSNGQSAGTVKQTAYYTNFLYRYFVGHECNAYVTLTVRGDDGRTSLTTPYSYVAQIVVEQNDKIFIYDLPSTSAHVVKYGQSKDYFDGGNAVVGTLSNCVSLYDIFAGRSLSDAVYKAISTVTVRNNVITTTSGFCIENVSDPTAANSRKQTTFSAFEAVVGSDARNVYFDATTGSYYISRNMLASVSVTLSLDGSYFDRGTPLSGLDLLHNVTNLTVNRDANLGDGNELTNLTTLSIGYSGVDLSTITTMLPNLRYLYIGTQGSTISTARGNQYAILYRTESNGANVYAFSYMPNLETLVLINSRCYDWDGLNGFLVDTDNKALSSTKLKTLRIYETNTNSNGNLTASATTTIIDEIYNLYTVSNGTTPTYYVTGAYSVYAPAGQTVAFVYGMDEPGEYNDFAYRLQDLAVKINGDYVVATNNQSLTTGETLVLPVSTFNANFGISYAPGAVDSDGVSMDSVRAFAISWVLVGIDSSTFERCFTANNVSVSDMTYNGIASVLLTYDNMASGFSYETEIVLNYSTQLDYDFYFVAVGHIGEGYFDKDSNYIAYSAAPNARYSFAYPILMTGNAVAAVGTKSFASIADLNLRFFVFSTYADAASVLGCIDSALIAELESQTALTLSTTPSLSRDNTVVRIQDCYARFNNHAYSFKNYPTYVCSLEGISVFSGLTNFVATRNMLVDVLDLSNIMSLVSVNLSYNLLTDFDGLTTQSLSYLDMSGNPLESLESFNNTVFKSSLVTLNLTNCSQIGARDLQYIAEATNLSANLVNLYLYGTKCAEDFYADTTGAVPIYYDAIYWLEKLDKSFAAFTMVSSTASAVSAADFDTFLGYYHDFTQYVDDANTTTAVQQETIGGYTYTKAFDERSFNWRASLGVLGSGAKIKVTITTTASEQLKANRTVDLIYQGSTANFSIVSGGVTRSSTLFDSSLVAYIFDNDSIRTITNQTITVANNLDLVFDTDLGLTSLEGMQYLSVRSLTVRNNPLINTWQQTAATTFSNTIQTLVLDCPYIDDGDLAFLSFCNNLTSLNLSGCRGVDFYNTDTNIVANLRTKTRLTSLTLNDEKGLSRYVAGQTGAVAIENYLINMLYANSNAYCADMSAATIVRVLDIYSPAGQRSMTANNNDLLCHCALTHSAYPQKLLLSYTMFNPTTHRNPTYGDGVSYIANLSAENTGRDAVPSEISWTVIDSTSGTTIYLPTTFVELGKTYNVVWSLWSDSGFSTQLSRYSNGVVEFSRGNLATYVNLDSVCLRAQFYLVTNGQQASSPTYETAKTISFTNKNVRTSTNTNYFVQLLGQHTEYGTEQYTDGTYYYYRATDIFASGRLIYYMFNSLSTGTQVGNALFTMRNMYNENAANGDGTLLKNSWAINLYSYVDADGQTVLTTASSVAGYTVSLVGKVMTNDFITNMEYFYLPNEGITNLRGLEIFSNMRAFQIEVGASCDISSFEYLTKLEYFYFYNDGSASDRMFDVTDFSPLVTGAKNTLKEFVYGYSSGVPLRDLSFLATFQNLEKAVLFSMANTNDVGMKVQYFNTVSFKTLLAYMTENRPNAKFFVGTLSLAQALTANDPALSYADMQVYNTLYPTSADNRTQYRKTLYNIVLADMDYVRAQRALYKYDVCGLQEEQSGNLTISYSDLYRLNVMPSAEQYGTRQTLYLAAYINDFGRYYAVSYTSGDHALNILGYKLLLNGVSLIELLDDLELVQAFVAAGVYENTQDAAGVAAALLDMDLTYEQLCVLLTQTVIAEYINNEILDFAVLAAIDLPNVRNLHFALLTARVYIGEYAYERMLTIGVN